MPIHVFSLRLSYESRCNASHGGICVTDERESDRELIGVAPGTIALIMGIITIVVPLGIVPTSYGMSENGLAFIEPIIYGLFWSYVPYWYNPYSFFNIFSESTLFEADCAVLSRQDYQV